MKNDSSTICFRVNADARRVFTAVAYADLASKRHDATPGQVNLSEFVRGAIEDFIHTYIQEAGGTEPLLEHLRAGEVRELEEQLAHVKELQDLESQLDQVPTTNKQRLRH